MSANQNLEDAINRRDQELENEAQPSSVVSAEPERQSAESPVTVSLWHCGGAFSDPHIVTVVLDGDNNILRTLDNWPYRKDELFATEKESIAYGRAFVIKEIDRLQTRVNALDARYEQIEDAEMKADPLMQT